jgi:hypothetical protein
MSDHPMDGLMPVTIGDKMVMARTLAESGLIPKSLDTPAKVFIALQMGHELGLKPMVAVNNITAINGKPTLSADLMVGLAKQHQDYAGMEVGYSGEGDALRCDVSVKRTLPNGETETGVGSFSLAEAKEAGLWDKAGGIWQKYTRRMLKHRASAYAIRDVFPDLLAGLHTTEEIDGEDFSETPRDVTPGPTVNENGEDMVIEGIAAPIRDSINDAREFMTDEQYEELMANLEKYKAQGAQKLTDFRRFLMTRLATLRKNSKPKKAAKPKDPEPVDAEVVDNEKPKEGDKKLTIGVPPEESKGKDELKGAIDKMQKSAEKFANGNGEHKNGEQEELEIY